MYNAVCRRVMTKCPSRFSTEPFKESSSRPDSLLLYIEGNRTRMNFGSDKKSVVETWNQFVASLSLAFFAYYEARKVSERSRCKVYSGTIL